MMTMACEYAPFGYEIWNDGCCIRSYSAMFETYEDARNEAFGEVDDILTEEGYENDTEDDFEIKITNDDNDTFAHYYS